METFFPTICNALAALMCVGLAIVVLARNHTKITHRMFAVLAVNLSLWAAAVAMVIQTDTDASATFWVTFTEMVACFLPAVTYHFVCYFPRGRFEGNRWILGALYLCATVLYVMATTEIYIKDVQVVPGYPPRAEHGPAFAVLGVMILTALLAVHNNLRGKGSRTEGQDRRQAQFVLFGIYSISVLSILGILGAEMFGKIILQAYLPVSTTLFAGFFAYAMIRFHLLDTRMLVSKAIVNAIMGAVVLGVFLALAALGQRLEGGGMRPVNTGAAILTTVFVVICYQRMKEFLRNYVEGTLLKQRYDIHLLYRRIAEQAAAEVQLGPLLESVAGDIQHTLRVNLVRVMLVDEKDPSNLITYFSTLENDGPAETREHGPLMDYLRRIPQPLLLEKILHRAQDTQLIALAAHLADLEAYFCLPLITNEGIVGILTLGQKQSHDVYSEEEVAAFRALAGPFGTAIANARLYQELEDLHQHLARVFAQMREGVIAVDLDGAVTTVNDAVKRFLGPIEPGAPLDSLPPEVAAILRKTLREQRPISDFETSLMTPRGEPLPILMSSSCFRSSGDETTGAVALLYDLSQIKQLEENVIRADRLSSVGVLAAGMAHEIKNPLVSIKTFAQLLRKRFSDEDFRATFEEVVPHEVDRIDTIVSRLLDFAKPRPINFGPLSLESQLDEVIALVDSQARKANVEVVKEFPSDPLVVVGDDQQLHQVFLNLVLNAIESMHDADGGRLVVRARTGYAHFRKRGAAAALESACARISITDTGCGISEANLQALFTPFYTTKEKGCGLGLSVVHGIVAEHGGEVHVQSVVGRGTTFTVTLPLAASFSLAGAN